MNTSHLAALLLTLAACSTTAVCAGCGDTGGDGPGPDAGQIDELPAAFRVDAEIVGVDGPVPQSCIPTTADVNPDGPDWQLEFRDTGDPAGPKVGEVVESDNGHQLANCDGFTDCCDPVIEIDGGWSVTCHGAGSAVESVDFLFTFFEDGTGSSMTTLTHRSTGQNICTAVAEWTAIAPL